MRFGSRRTMAKDEGGQGRIPETSLQCIRHLRHSYPRSRISVEVERPARKGLRELAAEADVVFYSKSWAEVSRTSVSWPRQLFTTKDTGADREGQGEGYASAEACLTGESSRTTRA